MQYVARAGGYVYNQWNSLNPATLSGAIDVIVIEQEDGTLHTSPWHIRFGVFQIFKPSQKKIDLYVNGIKTDLPMKLGDDGEAFFVFETDNPEMLSKSVLTSPVISPESSPGNSPRISSFDLNKSTPDNLDLKDSKPSDSNVDQTESPLSDDEIEEKIQLSNSPINKPESPVSSLNSKQAFEKARKITEKLKIPSKIDVNGDMVLDMDGYEPTSQKNIENSDEIFQKLFFDEAKNSEGSQLEEDIWRKIMTKDENGNIRILNTELEHGENLDDLRDTEGLTDAFDETEETKDTTTVASDDDGDEKTYFKTLRLTSDQLKKMGLKYGCNDLKFKSSEGKSQIEANLYLWKSNIPIVISDIDGTITKSDALGHVLNLIGRDWTHTGVATLFQDIAANGYNIIYLTARSVGQSDTTRQYLQGIQQDGVKLPGGPVILSPDRTLAALKREIVLKKPEVFKMACLNDIKSLYFNSGVLDDDERTPFYAGFGNRITDAISYRSVKIPSHRIFTINPNGEVHMELLELTGQKSSYLLIGELVDLFFPPLPEVSTLTNNYNKDQYDDYINYQDRKENAERAASPSSPRSPGFMPHTIEEKYTDVNYWREPINLSDLSDFEEEEAKPTPKSPTLLSTNLFESSFKMPDDGSNKPTEVGSGTESPRRSRPTSMGQFTSPLKNFMMFGNKSKEKDEDDGDSDYVDSKFEMPGTFQADEDDYTGEDDDEDDEDDDDYEDDYDEEDDYDDDYYEDEDEEIEDGDLLQDEVDDEDLDYEGEIATTDVKEPQIDPHVAKFVKASKFEELKIDT